MACPRTEQFKALLHDRDLTQAELARQAGVARETVNAFIQGRRGIEYTNLIKLMLVLGPHVDYYILFNGESRDEIQTP